MITYNPFRALALQTRCDAINRIAEVAACREKMAQCIARIDVQIAASKAFVGDDLKLVVLPEYFMTSFPIGPDLPTWKARACIHPNGAEYDLLGKVAVRNNIYLSGNAYEIDPAFPDHPFQISFILSPTGERILCYRRIISMYTATPHDVWDKFVANYGAEAAFPVVSTPLGNLACVASEEILFPEIARSLCLRGAEILLHSSSEVGSNLATKKGIAKRARALENLAFVVSANSAGIFDAGVPSQSTDGGSQVIDTEGRLLAEAGYGESMVACAEIDAGKVRHSRARIGMDNYIARLRTEPFLSTYQRVVYPANTLDGVAPSRARFHENIGAGIASLGNSAESKSS